jgi:hypothetical protein
MRKEVEIGGQTFRQGRQLDNRREQQADTIPEATHGHLPLPKPKPRRDKSSSPGLAKTGNSYPE